MQTRSMRETKQKRPKTQHDTTSAADHDDAERVEDNDGLTDDEIAMTDVEEDEFSEEHIIKLKQHMTEQPHLRYARGPEQNPVTKWRHRKEEEARATEAKSSAKLTSWFKPVVSRSNK